MFAERCLRCVPHDEDTGGFFVTAIRKKISEPTAPAASAAEEPTGQPTAEDMTEGAETTPSTEKDSTDQKTQDESKGNKRGNRHHKNPIDLLLWDDESFRMVRKNVCV